VDQDFDQFVKRHIVNIDKDKSVLKSLRKLLSPSITFCRVLSCEDSEIRMGLYDFLSFYN